MTKDQFLDRYRAIETEMMPHVAELGRLKAQKAKLLIEWEKVQRAQIPVRKVYGRQRNDKPLAIGANELANILQSMRG
jgi:hypothetical protein